MTQETTAAFTSIDRAVTNYLLLLKYLFIDCSVRSILFYISNKKETKITRSKVIGCTLNYLVLVFKCARDLKIASGALTTIVYGQKEVTKRKAWREKSSEQINFKIRTHHNNAWNVISRDRRGWAFISFDAGTREWAFSFSFRHSFFKNVFINCQSIVGWSLCLWEWKQTCLGGIRCVW